MKSCRKDSIIETLNFLSKALNEGINKDDAIDKLCMKIQNFFPDFCQVCEQSYIVKYEDKHLMKCGSCGQEVHRPCYLKLLKSMNLLNENEEMADTFYRIPGMYYLCASCQNTTINFFHTTQNTEVKSSIIDSPPTENESPVDEIHATQILSNSKINTLQTSRSLPLTPKILLNQPPNESRNLRIGRRTEFMKNKFLRDETNNTALQSENTTSRDKDTNFGNEDHGICRFYIKGKCKYGISGKKCLYNHPKTCSDVPIFTLECVLCPSKKENASMTLVPLHM